MKNSALSEIVRFQTDRDLNKKEFTIVNENSSIAEELLEAHGFDIDKKDRPLLKKSWQRFVINVKEDGISTRVKDFTVGMVVDAYCDVIVFAVGAIMKLGYDPEKALLEAGKEINSREGSMIDGKWTKDVNQNPSTLYKADYDKCKSS